MCSINLKCNGIVKFSSGGERGLSRETEPKCHISQAAFSPDAQSASQQVSPSS